MATARYLELAFHLLATTREKSYRAGTVHKHTTRRWQQCQAVRFGRYQTHARNMVTSVVMNQTIKVNAKCTCRSKHLSPRH
jgi:hypothetical protein